MKRKHWFIAEAPLHLMLLPAVVLVFIFHYLPMFGIVMAYESIRLPRRATSGSAGYDFFAPVGFELPAGGTIKIPTGVRAIIEDGWVLTLYPRSGLGFKFRFQLDNTVGVIDSDYARSDNEGHIFLKLTNDNREGKGLRVPAGTAFAQGVFLPFGVTVDDDVQDVRNGGLGSTTRV